ncbi:ABC transporter permease [bacterium]|jgi:peptide/nickel transport system permease protein|nr:ABC transporter permease [bacterium]
MSKKGWASIVFLCVIGGLALVVPMLPFWDPNSFDPNLLLEPHAPSWGHWMGTDDLNRDLLLRSIYGAQISLLVGLVSVFISITVGTFVGLLAGYFGGWVDTLSMRLVDIMMAIPAIFLILTIQVMFTPSIWNVILVIGFTGWMGVARLVRSEVLSIKERSFITAARARGIGTLSLIKRHILPHTINPIIVAATLGVGGAILTESVLSFLGLGVQPPHASWGNMLQNSLNYMGDAPWMAIVPGVLITLTVVSFNFIGDDLRGYFQHDSHASR